jgi:DNA-binding transcriptional regulator YbjK
MAPRREQVLDAAIQVLGTGGLRGLTHRAVDEVAGLPAGSTSNYFRSREALISGIVARLEARDHEDWARVIPAAAPSSVSGLSRVLAHLVIIATTTDRVRTQARYALLVEAATADTGSEIVGSIRRSRHRLAGWCRSILTELGATEPRRSTRLLVDFMDGMMLHQLTGSQTSAATIRRDLAAFLGGLVVR